MTVLLPGMTANQQRVEICPESDSESVLGKFTARSKIDRLSSFSLFLNLWFGKNINLKKKGKKRTIF